MSLRYGIALIPDPVFTARVYRARQLICGQYGAWAAEMHMLHLPLVDYFQCEEAALEGLTNGLSNIAQQFHRKVPHFPLLSRGVFTFPDTKANINLDFTVTATPSGRQQQELNVLHDEVVTLLEQLEGILPDLRYSRENYRPRISLMQQADLPSDVLDSAVEFARAVLQDLGVPHETAAWRMLLVRFESDVAGEDWLDGGWAADLRWKVLQAFPL